MTTSTTRQSSSQETLKTCRVRAAGDTITRSISSQCAALLVKRYDIIRSIHPAAISIPFDVKVAEGIIVCSVSNVASRLQFIEPTFKKDEYDVFKKMASELPAICRSSIVVESRTGLGSASRLYEWSIRVLPVRVREGTLKKNRRTHSSIIEDPRK